MSSCSIEGCEDKVNARGWCGSHYMRWVRFGDPLAEVRPKDAVERLWARVNKDGPIPKDRPDLGQCWLWLGSLSHGYANVYFDGRTRRAHQVTYELTIGPVPEGLELDHLCKTPACVRPDHLEPVTTVENNRRKRKPECSKGHPMSGDNLYTVPKTGLQQCRTCMTTRLSKPQKALLAEIAEAGTLYVRSYGNYHKTVQALVRRGLVVCSEPDWSNFNMNGYTLTTSEDA